MPMLRRSCAQLWDLQWSATLSYCPLLRSLDVHLTAIGDDVEKMTLNLEHCPHVRSKTVLNGHDARYSREKT